MELARMNSECSQNYATRGIDSIPHMLFFLFKVRLNNGVFGGRWLTLTHWCAQRLWLKNGECEWAVGSVSLAQSNMLRPVHWNVSYSDPNSPPQQVSSPLLNTWLWCLSSFSRCVSVSHTSLYCCLCSGRPKEQFHNEGKRCVTRWGKCVHVFYERAGEYTCVCKKVYFVHFSPAAFSWKWLENKAPLSY